jgi:hypothetical protein
MTIYLKQHIAASFRFGVSKIVLDDKTNFDKVTVIKPFIKLRGNLTGRTHLIVLVQSNQTNLLGEILKLSLSFGL